MIGSSNIHMKNLGMCLFLHTKCLIRFKWGKGLCIFNLTKENFLIIDDTLRVYNTSTNYLQYDNSFQLTNVIKEGIQTILNSIIDEKSPFLEAYKHCLFNSTRLEFQSSIVSTIFLLALS